MPSCKETSSNIKKVIKVAEKNTDDYYTVLLHYYTMKIRVTPKEEIARGKEEQITFKKDWQHVTNVAETM